MHTIAQCKLVLSQDMNSPLTWIHCVVGIEYDNVTLVNLFLSIVQRAPPNEKINMWRRWGTPQNFFLAFNDELEKQINVKKTVEAGQ